MSTTEIRFPTCNFFGDGENSDVIPFMSDKDATKKLKNPNEKVLTDKEISIIFDYPLKSEFLFKFRSKNGFTRKQLADLIIRQYMKIYADENLTSQINVTPMNCRYPLLNRNQTKGVYGICCHDMEDLSLNSMRLGSNGAWYLSIDS